MLFLKMLFVRTDFNFEMLNLFIFHFLNVCYCRVLLRAFPLAKSD